jgi:hypothetical protein
MNLEEYYKGVKVLEEPHEQYEAIFSKIKEKTSMAIQDDYDYWSSLKFLRCGGKLLLLDQSDTDVQHIFFDDNVGS